METPTRSPGNHVASLPPAQPSPSPSPGTPSRTRHAAASNYVRSPTLSPRKRPATSPLTRRGTAKRFRQPSLPFSTMKTKDIKAMDPTDEEFQNMIELANHDETLELNHVAEEELAKAKEKLKEMENRLKVEKPPGFYNMLHAQQEEVKKLADVVEPLKKRVSSAEKTYWKATMALKNADSAKDYKACIEWEEIVRCGYQVLSEHLSYLQQKKDEQEARAKTQKEERATKAKEAEAARKIQRASNGDAVAGKPVSVDDDVYIEVNGELRLLDDVLEPPNPSNRARERKQKMKTVYKGKGGATSKATSRSARPADTMTELEFERFISKAWTHTNTKTKEKFSGKNMRGHGLRRHEDGTLHCGLCIAPLPVTRAIKQHLSGAKHQGLYKAKQKSTELATGDKRTTQTAVNEVRLQQRQDGLSLTDKDDQCIAYRIEGFRHALEANMSMSSLERFKTFPDKHSPPNLTLGSAHDLPRTILKAVRIDEKKELRKILQECFPEFATISDATPVGAEAEAVKIRMVKKNLEIVELLVSVKLFGSKLNGTQTANQLLKVVIADCGLKPSKWRAAMMDRASTNYKSMKDVKTKTDYDPTLFPCFSHSFNKPGAEFDAPEAKAARKQYNKGIKYRGKMAGVMKSVFGETVIVAGGVRWWIEWEQFDQLYRFSFDKVMIKAVPICQAKKYSEKSLSNLVEIATEEELPKIIVQIATISDHGRIFCESTYQVEVDDPMALTCYLIFDRLDEFVNEALEDEALTGIELGEKTIAACAQAAIMVDKMRKPLVTEIERLELRIAKKTEALQALQEESDGIDEEESTVQPAAPERGRRSVKRRNYNEMENGPRRRRAEPTDSSRIDAAKKKLEQDEKVLEEKDEELYQLDQRLGLITENDFLDHARSVVSPALRKYSELLQERLEPGIDETDLIKAKKAFSAAKLFDPLFLATDPRIEQLELLAEQLVHFGFPEFTAEFIEKLKKEIPHVIELAKRAFDWEKIDGADRWRKRVLERKRRDRQRVHVLPKSMDTPQEEIDEDDEADVAETMRRAGRVAAEVVEVPNDDIRHHNKWEDDPGERARRIWEWWRTWLPMTKIHHVGHALRLIVLAQPSSAATERVFSQLQFIRRVCGDQLLEDLLELRTLVRCNRGLVDDFNC